jgi:hypothetical protein
VKGERENENENENCNVMTEESQNNNKTRGTRKGTLFRGIHTTNNKQKQQKWIAETKNSGKSKIM